MLAAVLVAALPEAALAQPANPDSAVGKLAAGSPTAITTPAKPSSAAPQASADDQKFFAAMDLAIAPVRELVVDAGETRSLRDLMSALSARDVAKAKLALAAIHEPTAARLATWLYLRSGYGEPPEYRAFLKAHPDWPERGGLVQRMEEAILTSGGSSRQIKDYFAADPPATGAGVAALASAELAEGNYPKARELARQAWRELKIPASLETGFLDRFGAMIERADHKWRLDRLLIEDTEDASIRADRAAAARRLIPLFAEADRPRAEARVAVYIKAANAAQLLADKSDKNEDGTTDWGLIYHRVQTLRRQGKAEESSRLLLTVPTDQRALVNPDPWWDERRINAYQALDLGNAALAYDLVKEAGHLSVNPLKQQSFIAGWIALRHLNRADLARPHFEAMAKIVDGPLSTSKAFYWLGRTHEVLGNTSEARKAYQSAATATDTFHGMLARARLSPGAAVLELGYPAIASSAEAQAFNSNEQVRAAVIAKKSGLDVGIVRAFTGHLVRQVLGSEAETAMVAHLSEAFGDTQQAVRISKAAIRRGHNLIIYSYPIHPFPAYTPLRDPPELAFLLAVARQETEFNQETQSGPGARGLLQVMPVTARHVCSQHKLKKCEIARLMTDKSYNAMLASAYLGDRMGEFDGSYVLTLAGYNAGPGRARQWIRAFGDPRSAAIDPVDWIERIPFTETREYVAKVLSNLQVYRARLGERRSPLRIVADLERARAAGAALHPRPATAGAPTAAAGDTVERR